MSWLGREMMRRLMFSSCAGSLRQAANNILLLSPREPLPNLMGVASTSCTAKPKRSTHCWEIKSPIDPLSIIIDTGAWLILPFHTICGSLRASATLLVLISVIFAERKLLPSVVGESLEGIRGAGLELFRTVGACRATVLT